MKRNLTLRNVKTRIHVCYSDGRITEASVRKSANGKTHYRFYMPYIALVCEYETDEEISHIVASEHRHVRIIRPAMA